MPAQSSQVEKQTASIIVDNFPYGEIIYSYYQFLEQFHTRPESWFDLFEYYAYSGTKTKLDSFISEMVKQELQ